MSVEKKHSGVSIGLQPKHWKALSLWEEGLLSIGEIADACGMSKDNLYHLFTGDVNTAGDVAALFKSELDKITERRSAQIKVLTKDIKFRAMDMLNQRLKEIQADGPLGPEESIEVTKIMTALAKETTNVVNNSFSITKGLSERDIVDEFKRLSAVARFALNGGRVSRLKSGGEGLLPLPTTGRDSVQEEQKDSVLRASREAA